MTTLLDPIAKGFMLGITTGPFCFAACFPVLFSVALAEVKERAFASTWIFVGKFIGGRFVAYLCIGLIVGALGSRMGGLGNMAGSYATVFLSLILIGYGLGMPLPHLGICRIATAHLGNRYFPALLGILTGLNVCPPFLLAISYTFQGTVTNLLGENDSAPGKRPPSRPLLRTPESKRTGRYLKRLAKMGAVLRTHSSSFKTAKEALKNVMRLATDADSDQVFGDLLLASDVLLVLCH